MASAGEWRHLSQSKVYGVIYILRYENNSSISSNHGTMDNCNGNLWEGSGQVRRTFPEPSVLRVPKTFWERSYKLFVFYILGALKKLNNRSYLSGNVCRTNQKLFAGMFVYFFHLPIIIFLKIGVSLTRPAVTAADHGYSPAESGVTLHQKWTLIYNRRWRRCPFLKCCPHPETLCAHHWTDSFNSGLYPNITMQYSYYYCYYYYYYY